MGKAIYAIEEEKIEEYWQSGIKFFQRYWDLHGQWDTKKDRDEALRYYRKKWPEKSFRPIEIDPSVA